MRKRHPEHVNLERWLVSYADFTTLLDAIRSAFCGPAPVIATKPDPRRGPVIDTPVLRREGDPEPSPEPRSRAKAAGRSWSRASPHRAGPMGVP